MFLKLAWVVPRMDSAGPLQERSFQDAVLNVGGEFRFVGGYLGDTLTDTTIFGASMHFPVRYRPIKAIQDFATSSPYPVVMGGDFNSDTVC